MKPVSKWLLAYSMLVQILLVVVVLKTDFIDRVKYKLGLPTTELSEQYRQHVLAHTRIDNSLPDGMTVFIGDSITQSLHVTGVTPAAINYGIGNDTTRGVKNRLAQYPSLQRANALVLAIGVNDLPRRDDTTIVENIHSILDSVPATLPVLISAILPVDERTGITDRENARIRAINARLKAAVAERDRVHFLATHPAFADSDGNLEAHLHVGDGIHLSAEGYRIWTALLREALAQLK